MKTFLDDNFLLETKAAERLYHQYAAAMPIFDYHCHLPVAEIAENKKFANLTAAWLHGDHYKWRAMRANGVDEYSITGAASSHAKFRAWAATVPKTLRNPLYHWTHLELKNLFGITGSLLSPATADDIYLKCSEMLQQDDFSTRSLLQKMRVKIICTTDDPLDNLEHHQRLADDPSFRVKVLPTFRPDRAMAVEDPTAFNMWVDRLAETCHQDIGNYHQFLACLTARHAFFHSSGCRISDHGIEEPYADDYTESQVMAIFAKVRTGKLLGTDESRAFKSAMLVEFALMDHDRGWTQQFHLGALRNQNSRAFQSLGPDTGYDSIGDFAMGRSLGRLLDRLDTNDRLAKTILYVLNPRDNEMIATTIGNFQDGRIPGKIQFGSGWWFNDQKDGMERQIDALSNMGLLSRFVGMLTDSRSFLSFPRHEYFRRVLCNLFGSDMERGELPHDFQLIGETIRDICFDNATNYFGIHPLEA
ncbi:MAG: glucuronate isomerase [Proteobacteria bacterium]|nr:glucuronate isomerase [Pseudomonadota bacterium]